MVATRSSKAMKLVEERKAKQKKPRKLAKVLSAKKRLTAATKATVQSNSTDSPLLALPPEVRNTIFRYALGHGVIHISCSSKPYFCLHALSPRGYAEHIRAQELVVGHGPAWDDEHLACDKNWDTHRNQVYDSLALLQTCRQIHAEAALIPFASNTFIFCMIGNVVQLANRLMRQQREAINSMAIFEAFERVLPSRYPLGLDTMQKLTGLRHLTILGNVFSRQFGRLRLSWSAVPFGVSLALTKRAQVLKYANWQSAVVCLTVKGDTASRIEAAGPFDGFKSSCREAETMLLGDWDLKAEVARREEEKRAVVRMRREEKEKKVREAKQAKIEAEEAAREESNAARAQRGLRGNRAVTYGA